MASAMTGHHGGGASASTMRRIVRRGENQIDTHGDGEGDAAAVTASTGVDSSTTATDLIRRFRE